MRAVPISLTGVAFLVAATLSESDLVPKSFTLVLTLGLVVWFFVANGRVSRMPVEIVVLLVVVFLSILRSHEPGRAFLACAGYAVAAAAGFALASAPNRVAVLDVLEKCLRFVVVVSIFLFLLMPEIGRETRLATQGSMTGYFTHKNLLGTVVILGLVTLVFGSVGRKGGGRYALAMLPYLVAAILVRSSTVLGVVLIVGAVQAGSRIVRVSDRKSRGVAVGLTFVVAPFLVLAFRRLLDAALGALGRDYSLSGRDDIWAGAVEAYRQNPLGYGYGTSFGALDPPVAIIAAFKGWDVPSAHSGYLSMLVQAGWLGLLALVVACLMVLYRALKLLLLNDKPEARWTVAVAGLFVMLNITDTRIDGLLWAAFVMAACWGLRETEGTDDRRGVQSDEATVHGLSRTDPAWLRSPRTDEQPRH